MKINIFDQYPSEFENYLLQMGEKSYRANQIYHWIFQKKTTDFSKMSSLSKKLIEDLDAKFSFDLPQIKKKFCSNDGSIKYLLKLSDNSLIEMVLIPYLNKNTLCISSQVGCSRKCSFCATAKMGLIRNLKASEIIGQVYLALLELDEKKLTNIVFMGMGEPLDNYDNVLKAVKLLQKEEMFKIGSRRITISTSGVIPGIEKLARSGIKVKLAVSLNSAVFEKRKKLMPITEKYNLKDLKMALNFYSKNTKYRITFEYIMIRNFNMKQEDVKALIRFVGDLSCKINLIPWNFVIGSSYETPSDSDIEIFRKKLKKINSAVTIRASRGSDISAACGQLTALSK